MGAWGTGIWSDDTAQDLKDEYTCAFYKFGVEEALRKLDEYVRSECGGEEEEVWCIYRYSLADFMWKKGILTPEVRDSTIAMIDSGYAMDVWAEAGKSALKERQKVLAKLRAKLLSERPAPKKIKPNVHLNDIFENGDVITIQLRTLNKKYTQNSLFSMSDEEFHSLDGKYIIVQKIESTPSWHSALVPDICYYWLTMRLFAGIFDVPPTFEQAVALSDAAIDDEYTDMHYRSTTPLFWCESSIVYFRRRKYILLGNDKSDLSRFKNKFSVMNTFGADYDWTNPDSIFLAAIKRSQT